MMRKPEPFWWPSLARTPDPQLSLPETMRVVSLVVLMLGTTHAQPTASMVFNWVDKDDDMKMSIEELRKTIIPHATEAQFNRADKNGDGGIDMSEWQPIYDARTTTKLVSESEANSSPRNGPYILGAAIILAAAIVYDKKKHLEAPAAGVHELA